jgi:hypothetical protein
MLISKLKESNTWKKLPPFIKEAGVFNHISKIEKPFPEIGLKNILEPLDANFPDKPEKAYIGFTSQGMMGVWDLATMSMRGVCSCMHWDNVHSKHLIGSVTDPFLGIVYITDNTLTPYGIKFKWRSLVRFIYCSSSKSYKLLVERVYKDTGNTNPTVYNNKDPNCAEMMKIFKSFLAKHVDPKYEVIDSTQRAFDRARYLHLTYIPIPDSVTFLFSAELSMSDCGQFYSKVDDAFIKKFASQV